MTAEQPWPEELRETVAKTVLPIADSFAKDPDAVSLRWADAILSAIAASPYTVVDAARETTCCEDLEDVLSYSRTTAHWRDRCMAEQRELLATIASLREDVAALVAFRDAVWSRRYVFKWEPIADAHAAVADIEPETAG